MSFLFIHPRRGLFQLTKCQSCGHTFECENCTNKLTTYRTFDRKMELICNQCQTYYSYPKSCPKCKSNQISSRYGGVEDLAENLESMEKKVVRLDTAKSFAKVDSLLHQSGTDSDSYCFLTTRVFDFAIDYKIFSTIVFVQAENLLASPDYLVFEDNLKSVTQLLLNTKEETKIIFDSSTHLDFFAKLSSLNRDEKTLNDWFLQNLQTETTNRQMFGFPPFLNLLLLTSQEKKYDQSISKLEVVQSYLAKIEAEFPEIKVGKIYPARFLKRKNMYSHHLLIRFPRNYDKFFKFQNLIRSLVDLYNLQARLNPKNLF